MPSNSSGPGMLLSSVSCGRIDALTRQPRVRTWHYGPSAQAHPRVRQLFVAIASQPFADGEPQRPASGLPGEPSHGDGGAGCGPRAAGRGTRTRVPSQDSWCGHGPQHEGLCGSDASPRRYPAHCAEHERALQRHRRVHDPALRVCVESVAEEASRGGLRLDEDGGRVPENALPGLGLHGLTGSLVGTAYNLARMARLLSSETPAPQTELAA